MTTRALQLRLDQINVPAENPRDSYSRASYKRLKLSIQRHGMLVPVLVRPLATDEYALVDGFTRILAVRELGWTGDAEVPASVLQGDDRDALVAGVVVNQERERLSKLSEWRALRSLRAKGMTHAEAGQALNKGRSWATKLLTLEALPAEVLADIEAGEISLGAGIVLASYVDRPRVLDELVKRARSGDVSSRALRRIGEVASKQGITAARAVAPRKVALTEHSWARFEPVRDAVRAELHLSTRDDPETVLAALRERVEKLHAAVRR